MPPPSSQNPGDNNPNSSVSTARFTEYTEELQGPTDLTSTNTTTQVGRTSLSDNRSHPQFASFQPPQITSSSAAAAADPSLSQQQQQQQQQQMAQIHTPNYTFHLNQSQPLTSLSQQSHSRVTQEMRRAAIPSPIPHARPLVMETKLLSDGGGSAGSYQDTLNESLFQATAGLQELNGLNAFQTQLQQTQRTEPLLPQTLPFSHLPQSQSQPQPPSQQIKQTQLQRANHSNHPDHSGHGGITRDDSAPFTARKRSQNNQFSHVFGNQASQAQAHHVLKTPTPQPAFLRGGLNGQSLVNSQSQSHSHSRSFTPMTAMTPTQTPFVQEPIASLSDPLNTSVEIASVITRNSQLQTTSVDQARTAAHVLSQSLQNAHVNSGSFGNNNHNHSINNRSAQGLDRPSTARGNKSRSRFN